MRLPCPPSDIIRRAGLRDEKSTFDVEAEHYVIIFLADFRHRLGAIGAGVIDEDVERGAIGEEGVSGAAVRDVEHRSGAAHRLGRRLDLGRCARDERDQRARFGERGRGGKTDPAPRPRDESTAPIKTETGRLGKNQSASAFPA